MFEIKQETPDGTFHVKLNRSLSGEEILEIAQIAVNITRKINNQNASALTNLTDVAEQSGITNSLQTKLGERPVSTIKLGEYKEPEKGVRIRILSFPEGHKASAIKLMRDKTGLPIMSAKEIVYGNYPCVILKQEIANEILKQFRAWEIYATIEIADGS